MSNTIDFTLSNAILNCCIDNFSPKHAQNLLLHSEFQILIKPIVLTHLSESRRSYRGSIVSGSDELMKSALGILHVELHKKRRNGSIGFNNSWKTYSTNKLHNVTKLWIRHRLLGEYNRSHNEGSLTRSLEGQFRRSRRFMSLSYVDENSQLRERDIPSNYSIEEQLIQAENDALRCHIHHFINSLPFLAVSTIHQHIVQSSEMRWSLFPKLNPTSICKWMMSHPTGCSESDILSELWNYSHFSQLDWLTWIQQLPQLQSELADDIRYQKRKSKEYALVITEPRANCINDIRRHPNLSTLRESLRKNTNLTDSGVALIVLIALLRMYCTNQLAVNVHVVLINHYSKLSTLAYNDQRSSLVQQFYHNHCLIGKPVRFSSLFPLISQIRYGQDLKTLPQSKKDNLRRFLLVANSVAQQISSRFSSLGLRVR